MKVITLRIEAMSKKGATVTPIDAVELELLTPLCELTMVIAQAGQRLTPPLNVPAPLKPFLRFTHKLPMPGLRAVRRVLDAEVEWRTRVASAATEPLVGEAGLLYVNRPDGWRESFERLIAQRRLLEDADGYGKTLRQLERRLLTSEERVRALTSELTQTRRAAEERSEHERIERQSAGTTLKRERDERASAERAMSDMVSARIQLDRTVDALRRDNDELRHHLALASSEIAALTARVGDLAAHPQQRLDASRFLDALGACLDEAAAELHHVRSALATPKPSRPSPKGPTPSKEQRLVAQREINPSIREPMKLPGGLHADSVEAAAHLITTRNAVVLIDGYNLAKTLWPKERGGASVLRDRLIANLEGIASRTRRPFTVVFDGTGIGTQPIRDGIASPSSRVKVVYSPASKEADVVITEILAVLPLVEAVIVVSSDRRVQRLVESMGANVVSSQQFVAAFR
jgi:predicted RNA-binding protein with PIN domain